MKGRSTELRYLARLLPLLILLALCAAPAVAQDPEPRGEFVTDAPWPEYLPESWKEFAPAGGRFKALLPGTPEEKVQTIDSPLGKLKMHGFVLQTFAFYGIVYTDYPENDGIRDVNAFFNGMRDGSLAGAKAELLEEKNDNRFGSPGRFVKARFSSGHVARIRMYLIRNRSYMLSVLMPEKGADAETLKFYEETAMKFLDSFKPTIPEGDRFGDPRSSRSP